MRLRHGCGTAAALFGHMSTRVPTQAFSMPGHERPFCETIQPTKAAIETRPCLISAWRYHRSLHNTGWRGNAGVSLRGAGTRGQRSFERDRRAPEDRAAVRTVPRRPCRRWSPWPAAAGPTARCPTRRRSRLGVANKAAQTSASWRSGGRFERSIVLQAAPSCGQPRPISRLGPRWPATPALLSTCVATELDQHLAGLIPVLVPPGRVWRSTGRTGSGEHAANGSAHRWVRGSNGGQSQV